MNELTVIGLHRVPYSPADVADAVAFMWGQDLPANELECAVVAAREHFDRLRLVEIKVHPADAQIDWSSISQPVPGVKPADWQVPYDEELLDPGHGRWAFFLHFVEDDRPLLTPLGERGMPAITPTPLHLAHKKYFPPG
jgi:hypothetical protein